MQAPNSKRNLIGLLLFDHFYQNLRSEDLSIIFTPNWFTFLVRNVVDSGRPLHTVAKDLVHKDDKSEII